MVMGSLRQETEVAVIGAGPGGYVAALRLADLGKEVVLIDERDRQGGTCLLEGCIPSKTLINAVELAHAAREASQMGLSYSDLKIDPVKLRQWTEKVVSELSQGISGLLKRRGVEVIHGRARFASKNALDIEGGSVTGIDFKNCIIATGSRVNELPAAKGLPVWSSTEAVKLPEVPKRLLVIGGGYIGLELGLVYAGLGSKVAVAEFLPRLLMGADQDLVNIMIKQVGKRLDEIMLESKVVSLAHDGKVFKVDIEHNGKVKTLEYDQVLVSIGRKPNSDTLALEKAGIEVDAQGHIRTDAECRTTQREVFAIGDVAPGLMLAHKASREGKVAAEVIAGTNAAFDNIAIPAVVFTDPEIAWSGLTEAEASEQGLQFNVGKFPLAALGKARSLGRTDGMVKVISQKDTNLILGVGMVGLRVSELIAEATLALEMGATLEDLMVTIHPHPTLSESILEAAEMAAGTAVHVNPPRKRGS